MRTATLTRLTWGSDAKASRANGSGACRLPSVRRRATKCAFAQEHQMAQSKRYKKIIDQWTERDLTAWRGNAMPARPRNLFFIP